MSPIHIRHAFVRAALFASCFAAPRAAGAQAHAPSRDSSGQAARAVEDASLDSLLNRALMVSPRLRAARARTDAARARVAPAGSRPDPMLMAGIQNLPVSSPGFRDEMTMKMVGVSRTFPLWGKLGLARSAAEREVIGAAAAASAESLAVRAEVLDAYYDVAFADRALEILERSRAVLLDAARLAERRYGAGASGSSAMASGLPVTAAPAATRSASPAGVRSATTPTISSSSSTASGAMSAMAGAAQPGRAPMPPTPSMTGSPTSSAMAGMPTGSAEMSDGMTASGGVMSASGGRGGLLEVIQARQSATRLGEQAAQVREQRAAALARLNALLGRSGDTPLSGAAIPARIARAAVAASAAQVRFASAALGAPAADSPLPPLADLEGAAHMESPELLAHESMIAAQSTRVELARRSRLPDVDMSLEYGQRDRMPDMVSARVAIPLPVQRSRRQDQAVAEARADLAALEAEHEDRVARLHSEVGRLYATLERDRSQLALYVKAILPQGRAAVDAAATALQSGRGSLSGALTAQSTLFEYELAYQRALTDFAKTLAELERVVSREVLHDR